jgi:uncharacterized delta-60 repeat protein
MTLSLGARRFSWCAVFLFVLGMTAFGQEGALDTGFSAGTGPDADVNAVAIQSDGKILIGGAFRNVAGTARSGIARLNADGSLDSGFNPGTGTDFDVFIVTVQADGKILIGGDFSTFNGISRNGIARLNADGSLDSGFNPGTGTDVDIYAILELDGGQVLVGGDFTTYNGTPRPALIRLDSGGALDATFNAGNVFPMGSAVYDVFEQEDGKFVAGGAFQTVGGLTRRNIVRLNADGTLDAGFNPNGGFNQDVYVMDLQPDGRILAGGPFTNFNGTARGGLARLNPDGTLDTGFTPGTGIAGLNGDTFSYVNDLALQVDGKAVLIGNFATYNGTARRSVVRVNADGTLDTGFTVGQGANSTVYALGPQPDGRLVIGGIFTAYNTTPRVRVARLLGSSCTYTVSPQTIPLAAIGGTTTVTVTAPTGCAWTAVSNNAFITVTSGASGSGNGTVQISVKYNPGIPRSGTLTIAGQTVTVSQPAKNASTPGQFRPSNGFVYIRNSNDTGFANAEFFYGTAGDVPVSGDWDGNGTDTIGIYRNGVFFLRNTNTSGFADIQFSFGGPGDIPIVGDWDGDGIDTVGIVRGNTIFLKNTNTEGNADIQFAYGTSTDIFITGDWDGDGIDTIGCFRPTNGFVYIRNTNTTGIADFEFFYGQAGDKPVTGDWDGNGTDTIGIVRGNQWFLRNSNTSGFAEIQYFYGTDTDVPITGDWNGLP